MWLLVAAPLPDHSSGPPEKQEQTLMEAPESFLLLRPQRQCPLQLEVGLGFRAQELNSSYIRSFARKLFLMRSFFL